MQVETHLRVSITAQFVGCIIGIGIFGAFSLGRELGPILFPVLFFGCVGGGWEVPRIIFRSLVSAECPKCSGRAFPTGSRPITYICRGCGYSHRTMVSEGSVNGGAVPTIPDDRRPVVRQPEQAESLLGSIWVLPPVAGNVIGGLCVGAVFGYIYLPSLLSLEIFQSLGALLGLRIEPADVIWLAPSLGAAIGGIVGVIAHVIMAAKQSPAP
jgi:hypothetical protein